MGVATKTLMPRNIRTFSAPLASFANAVIVCDGNSLTAGGYGGGLTYPQILQNQNPFSSNGATVYNKGVAGQVTQAMINDAITDIDPLYTPGVKNILIAWEMGNQIYYEGDATAAYNTFRSYCLARKAVGWKIIVITLTPRTQTTTFGDSPTQYNNKMDVASGLLIDHYTEFADAIVIPKQDIRLATMNSTYFYSDLVHLVQAGNAVLVELIMEKILLL